MLSKKKGYYLLATFFLILFITNFNTRVVHAWDDDDGDGDGDGDDDDGDGVDDDDDDGEGDDNDDDNDGIDDDFEEENKRDIDIEFSDNEFQIDSQLRNGEITDEIQLKVKYDEDGISIEVSYKEESEYEESTELEFNVEFHKLIEFGDLNDNGVYDEFTDQFLQEIALNSFKPPDYTSSNLSNDTNLHYIRVVTTDDIFTAHIYAIEEFGVVNNTLITPNQIKINIEINNFVYLNSNSYLALYTKLESEVNFEEEDETEDEREGYAENERGVITKVNQFTGIFTWQKNATIDGISRKVFSNSIETEDNDENEQMIFLNYPYGDHIFHDPKIGIAGLLTSDGPKGPSFPLTILIVIILIVGALSVSVAYSAYYYTHKKHPSISWHNNKDFHTKSSRDDVMNKEFDFQVFEGQNVINKLIQLEDVNITALSADFIEKIDKFEMEDSEKNEFVNEMLSLTPEERNSILNMMLKKNLQLK